MPSAMSGAATRSRISSGRQVADRAAACRARASALSTRIVRIEPLQLPLDRVHRLGVEQLAQLGIAEQLAQLRLIDGERLRAALGERRVAVVDESWRRS